MKWGKIVKEIWQARNDIIDACNLSPSDKHGVEKADANDLDPWTIDELYNLLGTASVNIKTAMNKLKPHTTYHKEKQSE